MRTLTLYVVMLRSFLETPVRCLLRYDQTPPAAIVFTVTTSCLPWFRSEAFGHITNAILHVEMARLFILSFSSVITATPRCFSTFVSSQLLSGPRFRTQHAL